MVTLEQAKDILRSNLVLSAEYSKDEQKYSGFAFKMDNDKSIVFQTGFVFHTKKDATDEIEKIVKKISDELVNIHGVC